MKVSSKNLLTPTYLKIAVIFFFLLLDDFLVPETKFMPHVEFYFNTSV